MSLKQTYDTILTREKVFTYVFFFFLHCWTHFHETEAPLGNDTYLVFGSVQLLSRVGLTGSDLHVLVHQPNTAVLGVDFDYR